MKRLQFHSLISITTAYKNIPFDMSPTQLRVREFGGEWQTVSGIAMNVPDTNRVVHTVEIGGLTADTSYEFETSTVAEATYCTWNGNPSESMVVHWHSMKPFTKRYTQGFGGIRQKFKTVPYTIDSPVSIAQVSDTHGGDEPTQYVYDRIAAIENILCIVHSGDIANGNGGDENPLTWYSFFKALERARDTEGHIIPILVTIGNHETKAGSAGVQYRDGGYGIKPDFATGKRADTEWYYSFFPTFPGLTGYGKVDFGDYLSVWQLDPGISTLINDGQDDWLAQTLQERTAIPNKVVSLHYPPWPAGRRYFAQYTQAIQSMLIPIWEPHQPIVFSGHDHVFSVSPPIKGGTVEVSGINAEEGTYYLGSGTPTSAVQPARNPHTKWWIDKGIGSQWTYFDFEIAETGGLITEPREPHPEDGRTFEWEEASHFWVMEMDYNEKTLTAYNARDEVIHTMTLPNN